METSLARRLWSATQAVALATGLLLAGCDGAAGPAPEAGGAEHLAGPATALVDQLVQAPDATRFQGVRRYEVHWSGDGVPQTLAYRERVSADGEGRFALELLDLLAPPMDREQRALFELQHQMRQGFVHRYRDFRIRDLELFLANYQVVDQGQTVTVAGHACADLEVRRLAGADRVWKVAVELGTGLPLRVREEGPAGELLSLSEYETLDLDPDLGGVLFHEPLRDEQPLGGNLAAATSQLGFEPVVPKLVPDPWRLIASAYVEDPTDPERPWARYTYSDGLEVLVYLHGGHRGAQAQVVHSGMSGDVVQYVSIASWNALQARVSEQRVLAVGKAPRDLLLSLIQSAFY